MALKQAARAGVANSVKPSAGHGAEKGGIVALEPKEATATWVGKKEIIMTATTSAGVEDVIWGE